MLTAIHFNNQLAIMADEIRDVFSNRNLPAKLNSQSAVTQCMPQSRFRIRHVFAELLGKLSVRPAAPSHRAAVATLSHEGSSWSRFSLWRGRSEVLSLPSPLEGEGGAKRR